MGDKYISEFTRFVAELKKQRPQLEADQREGRALLWDKQIDRDAQQRFAASQVKQKAYTYQTD